MIQYLFMVSRYFELLLKEFYDNFCDHERIMKIFDYRNLELYGIPGIVKVSR